MDRAAIKMQARMLNKGKTFELFIVMLVAVLPAIAGGVLLFGSSIRQIFNAIEYGFYGYSGYGFGNFLYALLSFVLLPVSVGLVGYFVNFVRTRVATAGDGITYSYKKGFQHFGHYLGSMLGNSILIGLWMLVPLAGIVLAIIANYRYYFVPYLLHDNPRLTLSEARDISRRMTDGMKGELFVMELSFIGWAILTSFTFGFLWIYVGPYMETTKALYYENLRVRAVQGGIVHPQQFTSAPVDANGNPIPPVNGAYGQPPYTQQNYNQAPYGQPPMNNGYQAPVNQGFQPPVNQVPQQQPVQNPVPQQPYTSSSAPQPPVQTSVPGTEDVQSAVPDVPVAEEEPRQDNGPQGI